MDRVYWLALHGIRGIGGVTLRHLRQRFGSLGAVFHASAEELLRVPRITAQVVSRLRAISLDAVAAELDGLTRQGIQVLTWEDAAYPANLRVIDDAPPLLFVRGGLCPTDWQAVAVVGTRQPSRDKEAFARNLAHHLAEQGCTVVSGFAQGIDTAAHEGVLRARNGRTLAVLGCGLSALPTRADVRLVEAITRRGALLSELRPRVAAHGLLLMARNRIISGLCKAVIVVEAGERSGSFDTALRTRRQGRFLFAVPGSRGTEELLKGGAESLDPQVEDLGQLSHRVMARIRERPDAARGQTD
jgi:DNA processing protein